MAFLLRWWINALVDGNKFVVLVTMVGAAALAAGPFRQALAGGDPMAIGIAGFVVAVAVLLVVLAIVDRRLNPPARKPRNKAKSKAKLGPVAQPGRPADPPAARPGSPTARPSSRAAATVATRPARPAGAGRMAAKLAAEGTIRVGEPYTLAGPSPEAPFEVVFEDDGATGTLYGLDRARAGNPILDALHIYDVEQVADRGCPSVVQLVWSRDGLKAALLINRHPHAVFDFEARRGYCRTGSPPPDPRWTEHDHAWDDAALDLFRPG